MFLARTASISTEVLYPGLRSLVSLRWASDRSTPPYKSTGKSEPTPSRIAEIESQRHTFTTSISPFSTEFEEARLAKLEESDDLVVQQRKMGAACLTMNRPETGNSLTQDLMEDILKKMKECDKDEAIKAIIITGRSGYFSVGADVSELAKIKSFGEAQKLRLLEFWQEVMKIRKPIIAAVDGECSGGGLELAMACDIVYASVPSKFALPDIKIGLIPGGGGTQRLTRRVGKARAMEMILLGESMDAFDAKRYGLCTRVVPSGEVVMLAFEKAQEIVMLSEPVVAMAKEVINASFEMPLEEGLMLEKRELWTSFALEDPHEGMAAYLEKRKPVFKHK